MMKAERGVGSKMEKITLQDESSEFGSMCDRKHNNMKWIDYTQEYTSGWIIRRILKNLFERLSLMYQSWKTIAHSLERELHEDNDI